MCPKSTGEGHWSRYRVHLTNSCQPASLKEQGCAAPALLTVANTSSESSWGHSSSLQTAPGDALTLLKRFSCFQPVLEVPPVPYKGSAVREEKPYRNGISLSSRAQRAFTNHSFPSRSLCHSVNLTPITYFWVYHYTTHCCVQCSRINKYSTL